MGTIRADAPVFAEMLSSEAHPATAILSNRLRFEKIVRTMEIGADFLTIVCMIVVPDKVCGLLHVGNDPYDLKHAAFISIWFAALFVILMDRNGAYESANSLLRIRETERILRVSAVCFGILLLFNQIGFHLLPQGVALAGVVTVPLGIAVQKQIVYQLTRRLHAHGYGIHNVIIYGAGETGKRLFSALVHSPKLGLRPVGIVDDDHRVAGKAFQEFGYRHQHSMTIMRGPLGREAIHKLGARLILVGIPNVPAKRLNEIADECFAAGSAVAFVPYLRDKSEVLVRGQADLDGIPVASLMPPGVKPFYEFCKNVFDALASLALILAAAPVCVLIGLLVKLDSPGPIFFKQIRIGRHGVPFTLFKFRSMSVDAPKYGYHPKTSRDPRITRIGKWLRRTSLDELPQLFNVLHGDMSLVGPRPEMPFIVRSYDARQRQRLQVKPGITGLWQISADRASLIHENLQYDLYYIRHRSFFMDCAVLLHTLVFAMQGI